ncbi:MAG: sporulation protein YabP [Clostridia bacterium]|nr:sporulation protein YabP [Clostridia bacterium]
MENTKQKIILEDRKKLVLTGISDVVSFDDLSVVLDTVVGRLIINGEGLHIQKLCLDSGDVEVEGRVDEVLYEDANSNSKKGFLGRIVK